MEHEFHNWLKSQCGNAEGSSADFLRLGIGDDAAMLAGSNDDLVITTDTIAEGTHFTLDTAPLHLIGRKSLAVNLSDIAAMGASPHAAVLTFLMAKRFGLDEAQALFGGIKELADQFNVAIVGGDTNRWDGPLVVGATVLGRRKQGQHGWNLSGAKPGDAIVVSGPFGGSIHGHHLSFTPRVDLGLYLAEHYTINAATDATDSLTIDLNAIVSASSVGIDLRLDQIPISSAVKASDPDARLQKALNDGEDFELILSVPQNEIGKLLGDQQIKESLSVIGTVTDEHLEIRGVDSAGEVRTIEPSGYIH